ncbi:MAG: hypothetical protein H0W62_03840 [Chitinophagales bacterium]|nr:hypothetical protein [Chitinophagales bacterium]
MEKDLTSSSGMDSFRILMKKIRSRDLKKFIEEFAVLNQGFRTDLLLHFTDKLPGHGTKKFLTLLSSILYSAADEKGFISKSGEKQLGDRLNYLFNEADDQLLENNFLDPFHLAVTLIELPLQNFDTDEIPELFESCIGRSFDILQAILSSDAGYDLKEEIINLAVAAITKQDQKNIYWLNLLANDFIEKSKFNELLKIINNYIETLKNQGELSRIKYFEEYLLRRKVELLEIMNLKEEAQKVISGNLHISSFRAQLIDTAILQENFSMAKKLIKESKLIEEQQSRLNVSSQWDKMLLMVAQKENDIRNIRNIALRLFFEGYDINYYRIVKETYSLRDWKEKAESIADKIKSERNFGIKNIYALSSLYIEEQDFLKLLQLLKKNESLGFAESCFEYLKDKFPVEVVEVYKEALRRYAEHNLGRNHYIYLCTTMKKIQSLPSGNETIRLLVNEFKVKYSHRRNMVKELNKVIF